MIPSEQHLFTSIVIDFNEDDGIAAIPSDPPGHSSCLSSLIDNRIGTAPREQYKKILVFEIPQGYENGFDKTSPSEPPGHGSHLSSPIDDGIGIIPGEHYKKTQGFEMCWDNFWGASVQDLVFASKDPAGIIRALTEDYKFKLKGIVLYVVRLLVQK